MSTQPSSPSPIFLSQIFSYFCKKYQDMNNTMTFDNLTYEKLKKEYLKSVESKKRTFTFEGHQFLTDYAKYLLQYLKPKFEN